MNRPPPESPLFPSPTLSRSPDNPAAPGVLRARVRRDREDAAHPPVVDQGHLARGLDQHMLRPSSAGRVDPCGDPADRKSTRLNSSHANISYAVFCLKKKNLQ